jgi:thiol-disulfide isomerase/thioredoxin
MLRKLSKHLYNIIIISFLAVALWQAFSPFILRGDEITQVRQQTRLLRGADIAPLLVNAEQKPTLLFLYAGWCGQCRVVGPKLLAMAKKGTFDGMNLLFISMDEDEADFARYFVMNNYHKYVSPYMLDLKNTAKFQEVMRLAGSNFAGAIPYIGVFDAQGRVVSQHLGNIEDEFAMLNMLAGLRSSRAPFQR